MANEVSVIDEPILEDIGSKKKVWILSEEEKYQLVQRIALFEPWSEIHKWIVKDLKKNVKPSVVRAYATSPKWMPLIRKIRDEYNGAIMEIPLANKRMRVEKFSELYSIAMDKRDYKEARGALKEIREEMCPDPKDGGKGSIFIAQQFNNLDDKQIAEERLRTINDLDNLRKRLGMKSHKPEEVVIDATHTEGEQDNVGDEITVRSQ
jgi:hypothetical protein